MFSLEALGRQQLHRAHTELSGHSTTVACTGRAGLLRHTLIALRAGSWLYEHIDPGDVTIQVLLGRVRIHSARATYTGRGGDMMLLPAARHSLEALADSVVLLTTATSSRPPERD
jgi:quercetin dioxygenase-like cupin family protein